MGEKSVKPIHNVFNKYRRMNLVNPYLFAKLFVSTWRTSNTSAGSSTSTQIKLPLVLTGTYNFRVEWGDGSSDTITVWNQAQTTHTYSVAGDYTIKINGTCIGWQFNNTGDRLKLLNITSWGFLRLGSVSAHFYGCANLNLSAVADVLDLTGTTSLADSFNGCTALTTVNRMNDWTTSSITSMANTFRGCTNFNQNIGLWNVANVTTFVSTFQGASSFNQNIGGWNVGSSTTFDSMFFTASVFNQDLGSWNVSNSASFRVMFSSASAFNNGGSANINNWVFKTTGTIVCSSMFASASVFNQPIGSWNTIAVTDMDGMFQSALLFNQNIGGWNVTKVTTFANTFQNAREFNNGGSSTIDNWVINSTANVSMSAMFGNALKFNQPVGSWNTSRVTTMSSMFASASVFNQPIGSWNVSTCTVFSSMFGFAPAFNQNIGAWNVNAGTNFANMFQGALSFNNGGSSTIDSWNLKTTGTVFVSEMFRTAPNFNQPIGSWNMVAVVNLTSMFNAASSFNQNIGAWNVANVTTFTSMFATAVAFNNGGSSTIDSWTIKSTGSVLMDNMFQGCTNFNQPLNSWNMVAVTTTRQMFQSCANFNQPLNSWVPSAVTNFSNMFESALIFNQSIGSWNVSAGTNFSLMFNNSTAFNQNIGAWNVANGTNFTGFMSGKSPATFSTTNLDAIYNGWSALPSVKPSIVISFGTAKYTAASIAGRAILTGSPNNWAITDGGI